MRPYPQEFRDRVLAGLGRGEKASEIARRLEVSRQFVYAVRDRAVMDNDRCSRRVGGYRRSVIHDLQATIRGWIQAQPDVTLEELRERLATLGRDLKVPALWHQLNQWGLTLKKNPARQRARASGRAAGAREVAG
jgi:transposase